MQTSGCIKDTISTGAASDTMYIHDDQSTQSINLSLNLLRICKKRRNCASPLNKQMSEKRCDASCGQCSPINNSFCVEFIKGRVNLAGPREVNIVSDLM